MEEESSKACFFRVEERSRIVLKNIFKIIFFSMADIIKIIKNSEQEQCS